ncbi:MAG: glycerate kinase [Verrucomicrobiales bacterium]
MRILIASDKWKGSLNANKACAAMGQGLRAVFPSAEIVIRPIADGGEGTVDVAAATPGSQRKTVCVHGPLGDPVDADYVLLGDGTAVIEMAAASGLALLKDRTLDPWRANTFGVGELMVDAIEHGARRLIVGLGGSATNDGGGGMAQALGWQLHAVECWPADWQRLSEVKPPTRRHDPEVLAASDVINPLLGSNGCTRIFGPQKGILEHEMDHFEAALAHLASLFSNPLTDTPGAGAAGGLGWGLMAFCGAKVVSGFGLVAELTGLETAVREADLIITGEGSLDAQTLNGKGPHGVAALAHRNGKKVVGIGGRVTAEAVPAFDLCLAATPLHMPLAEAFSEAAQLIERSICQARNELLRLAP